MGQSILTLTKHLLYARLGTFLEPTPLTLPWELFICDHPDFTAEDTEASSSGFQRQMVETYLYCFLHPFVAKQLFYGGKIRPETSEQRTPQMAI